MTSLNIPSLKNHLSERRKRLQESIKYVPDPLKLYGLLRQVDSALERIDSGSYGICDVCKDPIETERLLGDPLLTVCLDHLDYHQQKALEQDLEFAIKIQRNLLPENNRTINGWEFSYIYDPAGPVSGDFCDLIRLDEESMLFLLGDVSGKGISASLMMSHLHALVRSLLTFNLPLKEIVQRANRLFCESTLSTHYATMVFGIAKLSGEVEICIAGHNPPLIIKGDKIIPINATSIPIGLFCETEYDSERFTLLKGESLLLYTDGLTEASVEGVEYGEDRLKKLLQKSKDLTAKNLLDSIINDQKNFIKDSPLFDDITVAVITKN